MTFAAFIKSKEKIDEQQKNIGGNAYRFRFVFGRLRRENKNRKGYAGRNSLRIRYFATRR